jgi:hypothetical protein
LRTDADRIKIVVQQNEYNREKDMNIAHTAFVWLIVSFLFVSGSPLIAAITIDELAGICKKMESSIVDIHIEYEWYRDTPLPMEEQVKQSADRGHMLNTVPFTCKLSLARSLSSGQDSNLPVFNRYRMESSTIYAYKDKDKDKDKEENFLKNVTITSYDGKVTKQFSENGDYPESTESEVINSGEIDSGKEFKNYQQFSITLTPIGFSIFRPGIRDPSDKLLLSGILKNKKEFVRLDDTITKVNGFNTIRVDLLTERDPNKKVVYRRIYFSVDHGYTPVRFEYMRGERVGGAFDVQSLEQVAEGLWFPSSGIINDSDSEVRDGFRTIGKIIANQGLTDKDFDIEFPAGTRVYDRINDRGYVVKPAGE